MPHVNLPKPLVMFLAFCGGAALFVGPLLLIALATGGRASADDVTDPSATPGASAPVVVAGSVLPELTPKADLELAPEDEVNVALAPNVPPAATRTDQAIVEVHFDVVEGLQTIHLASGIQYETWGYRINGDDVTTGTPGPIIRARVGDVLRFTITNLPGNSHPHNVDFHAVTGQGGGAEATTVAPGETVTIEARLLYPGIFMYHCAYGDVPLHIAAGMYGGILVDPADPLPEVEHELYMVQSEYYVDASGSGPAVTDRGAITDEHPEFVVFNGAVGSLTGDNAPHMQVGETMRIYFVNAGLNLISSFHAIGSHWDKVYPEGALLSTPIRGSQTTLVPAGGGTVVELIGQLPMTVVLVDHALARAFDKGAIGHIVIEGDEDPELFEVMGDPTTDGATPPPSAEATPVPTGPTEDVRILAGSGTFQDADAPDEFDPDEDPPDYSVNVLTVSVGTTVTWTNDDPQMLHTVTDVNGAFDSGFLELGESWSYTFTEPGEYEYFCLPHPWMRAMVIVEG